MKYTTHQTSWSEQQHTLARLRETVFVHEQHVPAEEEWDGKDDAAIHFLARLDDETAIGCARLLIEPHDDEAVCHVGRVAILSQYRRQGIGQQLMKTVIAYCTEHYPDSNIYLHAQLDKRNFYSDLGFVASGDVFMDAGIPHIEMWYRKENVV